MLAAVLNICTQEELKESPEGSSAPSAAPADRDLAERRKVIKNKILAVGRMAHFFSLLRYVMRLLFTRQTCSLYTARSRSGYRSSRASRARQDCHMARSHSALRVSRTPSRPSTTRASTFIFPSVHKQADSDSTKNGPDANRISKMSACHLSTSASRLLLLVRFPAQVQIQARL